MKNIFIVITLISIIFNTWIFYSKIIPIDKKWRLRPEPTANFSDSDVLDLAYPRKSHQTDSNDLAYPRKSHQTDSNDLAYPSKSHQTDSNEDKESMIRTMVLREAFFDEREIDGHKNCVVILAEVKKDLRKFNLFDSCVIDEAKSKTFKVYTLYGSWIDTHSPDLTHEEIVIFCYDVRIYKNSIAFVRFYSAPNSTEIITQSVKVTHVQRRAEKDHKNKVVVCTKCYSRPPWLKEWLMYQKTLGVDLIQMYVEESFLSYDENVQIIKSYVQEGFVKIVERKTFLNSTQIYHGNSQVLNYNDCLYRNLGVYEFAFFLDTDDFFIPRLANKTVGFYLDKMFNNKDLAEIDFGWFRHYPDCGLTQPLSSLKNGNVTQILAYQENWNIHNTKYVCRPLLTTLASVHSTFTKLRGTKKRHGNDKEAYVAHVRQHRLSNIPNRSKCKVQKN